MQQLYVNGEATPEGKSTAQSAGNIEEHNIDQYLMFYCTFHLTIYNNSQTEYNKLMSYINIKPLKKLIQSLDFGQKLTNTVRKYEAEYNVKVLLEDFQHLIDLAIKINNREKTRWKKQETDKTNQKVEAFTYGEFKLFTWALILYCLSERLELNEMKGEDFDAICKIFKNKSQDFVEFEVKCMTFSKEKNVRCWQEEEINMLTKIISENNTTDWKIISYILFKTSEKKYYRLSHHCREKWVNSINPTIKKGEWTLEEDIEIFQLINLYGCRWALLSRELMGTRSEHAIKNRYNSVVKTMRKQYKITNSQDLQVKVLKYLKFKESKRINKDEQLNFSNDSKQSRERSREVKEQKDSESENENEKSMEKNAALFDDVFDVGVQFKTDRNKDIYVKKLESSSISEGWLQEKKEKRTWQEDYEGDIPEISLNGTDNFWTESLEDQISSEKYNKLSGLYSFEDESYRFFGSSAFNSQDIYENMKEVREDIQEALGCTHYEKLMSDEWLFSNEWEE